MGNASRPGDRPVTRGDQGVTRGSDGFARAIQVDIGLRAVFGPNAEELALRDALERDKLHREAWPAHGRFLRARAGAAGCSPRRARWLPAERRGPAAPVRRDGRNRAPRCARDRSGAPALPGAVRQSAGRPGRRPPRRAAPDSSTMGSPIQNRTAPEAGDTNIQKFAFRQPVNASIIYKPPTTQSMLAATTRCVS